MYLELEMKKYKIKRSHYIKKVGYYHQEHVKHLYPVNEVLVIY